MKRLYNKIRSLFKSKEIQEVPHQPVPPRDLMIPNYNEFWLSLSREIYTNYESNIDIKVKRKYTRKKDKR